MRLLRLCAQLPAASLSVSASPTHTLRHLTPGSSMAGLMSLPVSRFAAAAARVVGDALGVDPALFSVAAPPPGKAGDFAVGCFPAAKILGEPPAKLAARVVERF